MNRIRRTGIALAVVMASTGTAGCSTLFEQRAALLPRAEQIGVYEASPPGRRPYRFMTRLWIEPWKSAISVPRYASVEAGAADLRNQAAALGGDAIVNFGCYHVDPDLQSPYNCNGTVVKYLE